LQETPPAASSPAPSSSGGVTTSGGGGVTPPGKAGVETTPPPESSGGVTPPESTSPSGGGVTPPKTAPAPVISDEQLKASKAQLQAVTVTRDEPTSGGYKLEFSSWKGTLTVSLSARWVARRYLQVSREFLLGGIDLSQPVPMPLSRWQLAGPRLPYRMVPGASGPYGVLPGSQAFAQWSSAAYPWEALVPAAAAYDRTHGLLLAVSDDHPRKVDRSYTIGWRYPDASAGEQLSLGFSSYDSTKDSFEAPLLVSGLAMRDSVVLEPFEITTKSADPTLVDAETAQVIEHLADFVHAFHFVPQPPEQLKPGNFFDLSEWLVTAQQPAGKKAQAVLKLELPQEAGLWDLAFGVVELGDDRYGEESIAGIGWEDITGGAGVFPPLLQALIGAPCPVIVRERWSCWPVGGIHAKVKPDWLVVKPAADNAKPPSGNSSPSDTVQLELRQPQATAWLLRKLVADLEAHPAISGYMPWGALRKADVGPRSMSQIPISYPAAECAVQLRGAEELRKLTTPANLQTYTSGAQAVPYPLLAVSDQPRLCLPAFGNAYVINAVWSSRGLQRVLTQVFDVRPLLGMVRLSDGVLATTTDVLGYGLPRTLADDKFGETICEDMELLRGAAGELRVLYSNPAANAYTGGTERPADPIQLVALMPANLGGAATVWVAFVGIGGSVIVDIYNNFTVSWQGSSHADGTGAAVQGSWAGKLPPGYWEVQSPDPANVKPGDAVLVVQKGIAPARGPGSESG